MYFPFTQTLRFLRLRITLHFLLPSSFFQNLSLSAVLFISEPYSHISVAVTSRTSTYNSQLVCRVVHVAWGDENGSTYKILVGKRKGKRQLQTPRRGYEEDL